MDPGNDEVIQEFNEVVNMTASELEKWLKSDDSNSAGWPKEDENGETVGHDSGRKIVEILKENPKKEPSKYTDEQVQHMRKVVSKRHLAQETKANNDKSPEEVKKTKSYASLKNWGHDFLKAQDKQNGSDEKKEEEDNDAEEEKEEEDGDDEKQTGEKRRATRSQTGSNKKRETAKGESTKSNDEEEEENDAEEEDGNDGAEEKAQKKQSNGKKSNGASKKSEEQEEEQEEADDDGGDESGTNKGPKKGDTVSWNWGQGQPKGKVLDVKAEDTSITTKNGNEVSRKGDEEDPAVVLDTGKNKAIKKAHELN
ncbi:hypothetical protein LB507_006429 [Fusarium sp. FIESC RH6]|nr:hypothetical protein LB507_006429 [Fusarium sp. FIESC RH6]